MKPKPFLNATLAAAYIVLVAFTMNSFARLAPEEGSGDTILAPIVFLSLFTLSAAVMAYLFAYEPLRLYLDGKKEEALSFFLKTLASFAVFTVAFIGFLFYTATR